MKERLTAHLENGTYTQIYFGLETRKSFEAKESLLVAGWALEVAAFVLSFLAELFVL